MAAVMPAAAPPNEPVTFYRGVVSHNRWHPTRHGFAYEVFMPLIDLTRLDEVFEGYWPLAAVNRAAITSFQESAHMRSRRRTHTHTHTHTGESADTRSLVDIVRDVVAEATGERPRGRVCVLSHMHYFGYCFNPVSFYYVYNEDGSLHTILAEVTNTPWGEEHVYVLNPRVQTVHVSEYLPASARSELPAIVAETPALTTQQAVAGAVVPTDFQALARVFDDQHGGVAGAERGGDAATGAAPPVTTLSKSAPGRRLRFQFEKDFHVSPFMSLRHQYDWFFTEPGDTLLVQSQNMELPEKRRMFNAQLRLSKVGSDFWTLAYLVLVAFPLLTYRIQFWIHYEAFRLWWKGAPFHPHPHGSTNTFTKTVEYLMMPIMLLVAALNWLHGLLPGSRRAAEKKAV